MSGEWRDSAEGRWSIPLLKAALATTPKTKPGLPEQNAKKPVLFLLEYRDGLRQPLTCSMATRVDFCLPGN